MLISFLFLFGIQNHEVVKTLKEIVIAPFGQVKFRHFFLADILISAKLMLIDGTAIACFLVSGEWNSVSPVTYRRQFGLNYLWNILPLWWRFAQCLRRYYYDRSNKN